MTKREFGRDPLLLRVCAELGSGKITEAYLHDPGFHTDGLTTSDGRKHITINPAHQTIDTLIHECLHRLYPAWSETYVRSRTSFIRNRMSDEEVRVLYDLYQAKVKRRKTVRKVEPDE